MDEIIAPTITAPLNEHEEQTRYDSVYQNLFEFDMPKSSLDHKVGAKRKRCVYFNPKTYMQDVKFCKNMAFNIIGQFKDVVIKYR